MPPIDPRPPHTNTQLNQPEDKEDDQRRDQRFRVAVVNRPARNHQQNEYSRERDQKPGCVAAATSKVFKETGPKWIHRSIIYAGRCEATSVFTSRGTLACRARPSAQVRRRLICSSMVFASGTVCASAFRTCSVV